MVEALLDGDTARAGDYGAIRRHGVPRRDAHGERLRRGQGRLIPGRRHRTERDEALTLADLELVPAYCTSRQAMGSQDPPCHPRSDRRSGR
jgi:hypothetical protein